MPAEEANGGPVVGALGCRRMSNGGALVYWLELWWVLLPLLVHVVVVVVVVDLTVNVT